MLVHSKCCTRPLSVFPSRPFVLTYISLLVCVLLLFHLCLHFVWEMLEMVLCRFDATVEHLLHLVQPLHRTPQSAPFVARLRVREGKLPASLLHLHTGYHCPLRRRRRGLGPGGRRRGSGVGQALVSSSRDAGSDPGTDVFPVGLSEGQATSGLRGCGSGGGVAFDPAHIVVL